MEQTKSDITYPESGEVILIDKDLNWTSFNVVKKVKVVLSNKYGLKKLKVGHAGTLDPLATGLVIICTGKQTKKIETYQAKEKEYLAEITLGSTTPSFDLETEADQNYPFEHIKQQDVLEALKGFQGEQLQVPPLFSAKSIKGKRAYTYARKGKEIELKPNLVHFYAVELISFSIPVLKVKVTCSKGTYIRAFARDFGVSLNTGAHLTGLRRTRIGEFRVEDAMSVNIFEELVRNL